MSVTREQICHIVKLLFWWSKLWSHQDATARGQFAAHCFRLRCRHLAVIDLLRIFDTCCDEPMYFDTCHVFLTPACQNSIINLCISHEEWIAQMALKPTYLRHSPTVLVTRLPPSLQSIETRQAWHSPEMLRSTSNKITTVVINRLCEA